MTRKRIAALAACALSLAAPGVLAHDEDGSTKEKLGKVQFANSCGPKVQAELQRAVAMLHSFWYSAAEKAFEDVARQDPTCAIAAWGFASILMSNPLAGSGAAAKDAPRAQAAIDKGRTMGAKTQRERDYLEAVAAYYADFASRSERERQVARAAAYEKLAAAYPKDDEAQIFYALYLAGTQQQSDQTYAAYLKAAAILEKQFKKHPQHPGVAHYLIHSYDAPPIAKKGVPAAKLYANLAPDAPHALHMPSHIFTRVGAWTESAATNRRSADVAEKSGEPDEALHAMDYMTYAYLQLARDGDARKVLVEAAQVKGINPARFTGLYALAAMPARIALERSDWREAAQLSPSESRFPFAEAISYSARALGAARSGDAASAEKDLEQVGKRIDALKAAKNEYWATEVEVMRLTGAAWLALAQGKGEEALTLMRQAADTEDRNEKHIVTPGRILPARELLGDLLMELKRPAEALKEYELSQRREPDRLRGLYGAARAAEAAGDKAKATQYFRRMAQITRGGGADRPELQEMKKYLAVK
jgi:tetratricopeptide (TPR) repeat protein